MAKETWKRRQQLFQTGAISKEEWNRAESEFEAAESRYTAAFNKWKELESTRPEKLEAQAALVNQIEQQVEQVKLDIEKCELKAPFAGEIADRYIDEGTFVAPGTPIVRITQVDELEAVVGFPSSSLNSAGIGREFDYSIDGNLQTIKESEATNNKRKTKETSALNDSAHSPLLLPTRKAVVDRVLPENDDRTRTVPVVLRIDSPIAKPGQILRIHVVEERKLTGVWVPTSALLPASKGMWSIFVVEENEERLVAKSQIVDELLFSDGERTLIKANIDDGSEIISAGVHKISNNQLVSLAENAP